ncbi:chaperone NapD [Alsobacter sp. R-9]
MASSRDHEPSRRDLLAGRPQPARDPAADGWAWHVTGLVVHARPDALAAVTRAVEGLPGAEIHGRNEDGKLVVTLETRSEHEIVERMGAIGDLPGVLSTALVYHHFE